MTMQHDGLPVGDITESTGQSWSTSFDKLETSLHSEEI